MNKRFAQNQNTLATPEEHTWNLENIPFCMKSLIEKNILITALANFGECTCGVCDFCQNTCGDECDCCGCEENKVNGFYDENLNYKWIDGVLVCMDKEESK